MGDQQQSLVNSFPGFVEGMRQQLQVAESYRVGVITTDKYEHHAPPCSEVFGAFVQQTGGANSSNRDCGPFSTDFRYMTQVDDLESRFGCVAKVGTTGSGDERPAEAMLTALSPDLQRVGACNEGFLREDALLVVVIITDEEDSKSVGDPLQWHSGLVALKGGHEEHVVVLTLVSLPAPNQCIGSPLRPSNKLIEFANLFTHDHVGDVCASNYDNYFRAAVDVVDIACDDFEPPM
jgi:hypothetical protein